MAITHDPKTGQPLLAPRSIPEFRGFVTEKNSDLPSVEMMVTDLADTGYPDIKPSSLSQTAREDLAELRTAHRQWTKTTSAGRQFRRHQLWAIALTFVTIGVVFVIAYFLFR